jgi:fatty-acyl-CoA synthase
MGVAETWGREAARTPGGYLPDWVAHYARTQPARIALANSDTGEVHSWGQLEERVGRLAFALRNEMRLAPGDRIVTLTNGDMRCLELQFACLRVGLALAPLNFRLTAPELVQACAELRPQLMITDRVWGDLARKVAQDAALPRPISWGSAESDFERMARGSGRMPERQDASPDEVAMVLMTSGTTGRPKAALVTRGGLVWQALNQVQFCRVAERDGHAYIPLPLFHAGGLNSICNPVLFFGGRVSVAARFDPEAAVRYVSDPANRVTHLALVPVMYQLMADSPGFADADLSSIRCLLLAGGRLTQKLRDSYATKGVAFTTQYGGTETGPTVTALDPARADKAAAGSCGQKALHVQIRLVGQDGADVPRGQPGEVWVKGPAIIPAYIGRERSIDFSDGWFRTGDVAREDEEGFYYVVDRIKEMYKSGGENVFPAEVEQILAEHPSVAEVAVIGIAHEKWGEVGLAVVVPAPGRTVTLESLRSACEGRLARYKQPQQIALVDALPRNVTGKIARDELRRRFSSSKTA